MAKFTKNKKTDNNINSSANPKNLTKDVINEINNTMRRVYQPRLEKAFGSKIYDIYDEMDYFPVISTSLNILVSHIVTKKINIESNKKSIIKFIEKVFEQINIIELLFSITKEAYKNGIGLHQIFWAKDESGLNYPYKWQLEDVRKLAIGDDSLRIGNFDLTEENCEYKLLLYGNENTNLKPLGVSLYGKAYWSWKMEQAGWEFWLTALEKYGTPSIAARLNAEGVDSASAQEKCDSIAEQLITMGGSGAFAGTNIDEIKLIESRGSSEDFSKLLEECRKNQILAVLGTPILLESSGGGSYALAKISSDETFKKIAKMSVKDLELFINNTIIKWLVDLNFSKNDYAKITFDLTEKSDVDTVIKFLKEGFGMSEQYLRSSFNLPSPLSDEDEFISATAKKFDFNEARTPEDRQKEYPQKDENKPDGKLGDS